MKRTLLFLCSIIACCTIVAQDKLESMANRLKSFGTKLPQEQVFLHMDNNCHYLGDTIFYKAYVRRSDNGHPTNLSGILYCELLNVDGFLHILELQLAGKKRMSASDFLRGTSLEGWKV